MDTLLPPHVRPMTEDDLDAVMAIEVASYVHSWKPEHFSAEIAGTCSWPFVAVAGGRVIGYVCVMSLFVEAQILNVAVQVSHRGRGIARLLLELAFRVALEKGAEKMALEVRASNVTAISLYQKLGFVRVGIRTGYYESVEDAVLMEKPLI